MGVYTPQILIALFLIELVYANFTHHTYSISLSFESIEILRNSCNLSIDRSALGAET